MTERRPGRFGRLRTNAAAAVARPIGLLLGLYLVLGVTVVAPRITTDGLQYWAETRSAVLDGDLDVADEYRFDPGLRIPGASEGRREFLPRDLDGRFLHTANEGIIVVFAPFVLIGHLVAGLVAAAGGSVSMDGYDAPYVLAVGFGTNALVGLGLALLAAFVRPLVGTGAAVGGAVAIWVGSTLVHWSLFRPGHAHAPAVLLEALFVVLFLARGRDPRDRPAWLVMGAAWGLLVSIRPITGLYALVPLLWLAWLVGRPLADAARGANRAERLIGVARTRLAAVLPAGLLFLAGGLVGRLPQVAMTGDLSLAGSAYYEESGFGGTVVGGPLDGIASLLLDPRQGTLWWAPIMPLAIIGLAWFWRRDRLIAVAGVIWVAATWAVVGLLGYPQLFGGPTYASRHLVEATPVYVLGAAGLIRLIGVAVERVARGATTAGAVAGGAVVGLAAAWGFVQYVATEIVPGAASLDPFARIARVLGDPLSLRRLFVAGPPGEPQPGLAFIGGRFGGGLDGPGAVAEVGLALTMLVALGLAWVAIARVAIRWSAGPEARRGSQPDVAREAPLGRGRPSAVWAGRAAWALVAVVAVALVAPTLGRLRAGDAAIATWAPDEGEPPAGRLTRLAIGSTPTGNRVLAPPSVTPGTIGNRAPAIEIGGVELFGEALVVPEPGIVEVRADGRAVMRAGPWGPALLLRNATEESSWAPGPSVDPGSWSDSLVKTSLTGASLVVRVDAPWPILAASAEVMVVAIGRDEPATLLVNGSFDGETYIPVATFDPEPVTRPQHAAGELAADAPGAGGPGRSVWFEIDLLGRPETTAINGAWFDLQLDVPAEVRTALAGATAADVRIDVAGPDPGAPVALSVATDPSILERVAWAANDAVVAVARGIGPWLALILAVALAGGAIAAGRVAGRSAAVGLLALAVAFGGVGVAGLPRTILLPRTQAFASGELEGARLAGSAVVAVVDGATYTSPRISVPLGSRIEAITVEGSPGSGRVEVRAVAADGTPGPWRDARSPFTSEADGLQVRVGLAAPGDRLDRIRLVVRPPIGG